MGGRGYELSQDWKELFCSPFSVLYPDLRIGNENSRLSPVPFRFSHSGFAMSLKSFLLATVFIVAFGTGARAQEQQMQTTLKNMEVRLSAIEEQMRAITGGSEKNDYAMRRLEESLRKLQEDYDARITRLEKTPPPAAPVQQTAPQKPSIETPAQSGTISPTTTEGSLGGVTMRSGRVTGAIADPKAPPLPDKPADYGLTARETYDRAFDLLRQADYEAAQEAFEKFMEKFPEDKLIENARYWHAETFYVRGLFAEAAIAFAEAYQGAPTGGKAPDSLLKLAMALGGVGKTKDACSTLEALKGKFPQASSAIKDRTKEEWVRLKCK